MADESRLQSLYKNTEFLSDLVQAYIFMYI